MKSEDQKKIKVKMRLKLDEVKLLGQCIVNSFTIDDVSKEKGRRFFRYGDLERDILDELWKKMQRSYSRSRKMKIKRVLEGKSVEMNRFGFTFTYPEIIVLARLMCLMREVDERFKDALGWSEEERKTAENLWSRFLLAQRRSVAAKKGYLKRFGIEVDWETPPDYREPKWHRRKPS